MYDSSSDVVVPFTRARQASGSSTESQTNIEVISEDESTSRANKVIGNGLAFQGLLKQLNEVFHEAKSENWDGDGAEAISDSAYYNATRIVAVLPHDLAMPDVIPDNDGFIEFEWAKGEKNFSIYVTDTNLILYAGYYGENNRLSGRFNYEGRFPNHVELLSREVFKEEAVRQ